MWDFGLEFTPEWKKLAARERMRSVLGTLAQREPVSRKSIHAFLGATRRECVRVFDVNLRTPFYTRGVLEDSLGKATILKLNDEEMPEVLKLLKLEGGEETAGALEPALLCKGARALLEEFASATGLHHDGEASLAACWLPGRYSTSIRGSRFRSSTPSEPATPSPPR